MVEVSMIVGALMGIFVLIVIIVGIYLFYRYIRQKKEEEERNRVAPTNPEATFCVGIIPIVYTPPNTPFPIRIPVNFISTSIDPCTAAPELTFSFQAYNRPIAGTSPWCVYTQTLPGVDGVAYVVDNNATCRNSQMVMYLPATRDFAGGLIPLYIHEYITHGIRITLLSLSRVEDPSLNIRLIQTAYVFPNNS